MDQTLAQEILQSDPPPKFRTADNILIQFARQTKEDIETIELMIDTELVDHWKGLVAINYIIQQVSLNDLQRIELIELEFNERPNIDIKKLQKWFGEQMDTREEVADAFYDKLDELDQSEELPDIDQH